MDCKVTFYISEDGNFPFKRYVVNARLWEETKGFVENRRENVVKIYIKGDISYMKANKHNLVLKGVYNEEISDSNSLKEFIKINKPLLIYEVKRFDGNLAHLEIGAK